MFSITRVALLVVVWGGCLCAGGLYYAVAELSRDLPDLDRALDYRPKRASRVYGASGELIGEFFIEKRIVVGADRIPEHVRDAFIAAEDRRFWQHPGFDVIGIVRAARENVRSGETRQGASTITQQVAKLLLLDNERTYYRKAREVILSVRIERQLSKPEILHIYLNHVFLGRGAYGVQAGAEIYFGKDAAQLTVAEAAMLAGLVQAPSVYNPARNMPAARARQRYVLDRMLADGHVAPAAHEAALRAPIALVQAAELNHVSAPYFVEHLRQWATRRFGHRSVLLDGLSFHTSLDPAAQLAAEAAVRDGLRALDRRLGFRGPIGRLEPDELAAFRGAPPRPIAAWRDRATWLEGAQTAPSTVEGDDALLPGVRYAGAIAVFPARGDVAVELGPVRLPLAAADARMLRRWRRERDPANPRRPRGITRGDLIPVEVARDGDGARVAALAQAPDVEAALVALEPYTGRVRALVGGYDFARSKFNRATQAHRQIGSAIKPFIYAVAMDAGVSQLDIVTDAPVSVSTSAGVWTPKNYDDRYRGPVTLRTALAGSLNTVSVRLLLRVGVARLIELLRAVGMRSVIPRHISLALGTADLTPLEVTAGYAAFASGGARVAPRFVDRVTDAAGRVIYAPDRDGPEPARALPADLAFLTADLMQVVVARGTGRRAQSLGRPVAGKTGTSTGHRDAWFVGFTADLVCGVWVGRDDFTPIGPNITGGSAALPIWLQFVTAAHPDTPPRPFEAPPDVAFVRADEWSGSPMPAAHPNAIWIPFRRGTVPDRFAPGVPVQAFAPPPAPP